MTGRLFASIAAVSVLVVLGLMPSTIQNSNAKFPQAQAANQSVPPNWTEAFPAFKIVGNVYYVGSTKGCTTWTLTADDAGKSYSVVIVGSANVNPGYKLVNNSRYPEIASDYEKMFRVLQQLPCDIFLGAHGGYFNLEAKFAQLKNGRPNPLVDPEGYKSYVAEREQAFRSELAKQTATEKPKASTNP